ncbi:CapA family protein [Chloroflexota bacterium]
MTAGTITMLAVGDIILRLPDAESYFEFTAPVLKSADVTVGNLECVFTDRLEQTFSYTSSPPCDPKNMSALPFAGFNVLTFAQNHMWDWGVPGMEDTITGVQKYGITIAGAGMNIDEARKPAIIERNGTRFGFLNYNCVGPEAGWATRDKPGCAYVRILTHHEPPVRNRPPAPYTFAEVASQQEMVEDIRELRPLCDVLVVALHKGILHKPAELAMYEQPLSYSAIDAGADLVLGHHAHICKGIEQYKGKVIFHNLGNFVSVSNVHVNPQTERLKQLTENMKAMFEPVDLAIYPWHPESVYTMIAKCTIDDGKITRVSYLPCLVNKQGKPEVLKNDERGQEVFNYIDKITKQAGLNAQYKWEGDEIVIDTSLSTY